MFSYTAFNSFGNMQKGLIEAGSKDEALGLLSNKKLTPVSIREKKQAIQQKMKEKTKIKATDILNFTRQLLSLIRAGIPLSESLSIMIEQSSDLHLRQVITQLHNQVREGKSFSNALRQFPHIFTELYTNSVEIAETSGNLEIILHDLVNKLENDSKMHKSLQKALSYPAFLLMSIFIAFVVFTVYIIPKFLPVFENSKNELPLPTVIIIQVNSILFSYWPVFLLVIAAIGLIIYSYAKNSDGKYKLHRALYLLPFIGLFFNKISSMRFSKTTAILIDQGIPLTQAIHISSKSEPNLFFREKIEEIKQKLINGQAFSAAAKVSGIFPGVMIHMITIGEVTGNLGQMLTKAAEFFNSEITSTIDSFTSIIEPVITILLAIVVLFLALAIFLPMWNMIGIK